MPLSAHLSAHHSARHSAHISKDSLDSDSPISNESVDEIISWIREAGKISLSYFHNVTPEYKADKTFLTAADIEIQRFLETKIRAAYPTHAFIGEENVCLLGANKQREQIAKAHDGAHDDAQTVWVIDPLDGTTAFALGLPGWGISIGLLHRGKPYMGFFYMPQLDDLTYTTPDGKLFWNNQQLRQPICQTWRNKRFLAVNATAHADFEIDIRGTRSLGSIGANLVYTARGVAAATFAAKAKIWDLVACASIIERAGGLITYIDGTNIDYLSLLDGKNIQQPIIAAHPDILATLPQSIRARA